MNNCNHANNNCSYGEVLKVLSLTGCVFMLAVFIGVHSGFAGEKADAPQPKYEVHKDDYPIGLNPQILDGVTGGWWFNLGPTGARGRILHDSPRAFKIMYVFEGSPAYGKLQVGDFVIGANGKEFQEADKLKKGTGYDGPRMELGKAIEDSEGDPKLKGKLTFIVVRKGKKIDVEVQLRQLGYFSKTYPFKCKKSELLAKEACEFLINNKWQGMADVHVACRLALLAQGDTYMDFLKDHMKRAKPGHPWTWCLAMNTIYAAEYYLRTGDPDVKTYLEMQDKELAKNQFPRGTGMFGQDFSGAFGHHQYSPSRTTGYGVMAAPTALAGLAWALMNRAGINISRDSYKLTRDCINFSTKPNGSIGYGIKVNRPLDWEWDEKVQPLNGKNGTSRLTVALDAATLMHYIDPFESESENYYKRGVIHIANSRELFFDGHASGRLGALWGMIAGSLGPDIGDDQSYRLLMDYYKYWFNVNRCHDGSFYWSPVIDSQIDPYSDLRFSITGTAILSLTAHKNNLYILGRPFEDEKNWQKLPIFTVPSDNLKIAKIEALIESGKVGSGMKLLDKLQSDSDEDLVAAAKVCVDSVNLWKIQLDKQIDELLKEGDVFKASEIAYHLYNAYSGDSETVKVYKEKFDLLKKEPDYKAGQTFQKIIAVPWCKRRDPRFDKMVDSFVKKYPDSYYVTKAQALILPK